MNIFVSRPTVIDSICEPGYVGFHQLLLSLGHSPKRLGATEFSRKAPLARVIELIRSCTGAIVLGYPQVEVRHIARRSTATVNTYDKLFPTPWNQIEGALAYAHGIPVLVIADRDIDGGVFDHGVTGEAVLHLELTKPDWFLDEAFRQPFAEWRQEVEARHAK